jgi:hypothetical protein
MGFIDLAWPFHSSYDWLISKVHSLAICIWLNVPFAVGCMTDL